jgi:putative ABC transport system permease protein
LAQFLAESTALLAVGTVAGIVLARAALWLLRRLHGAALPRIDEVGIDASVLAFTAATAAVVAILFGVIPLARHRKSGPAEVFRAGGRGATLDRHAGRLRQLLVVSQVAMATVLLVGCGLMLRSFQKLRAVDPGFRPAGVITFRIALPTARYRTPEDVARFHDALLGRLRALPGVHAAGATAYLPLTGPSALLDPLRVEGVPTRPDELPPIVEMRAATPGYFEAMGIPLLAGRELQRSDAERRTGAVIVSATVAAKLMAGRQPIGARVAHGLAGLEGQRPWSDVVGVVGDVRGVSLREPPIGAVYYATMSRPGVQMEWLARSMAYAVRTNGPLPAVLPAVRQLVRELDPMIPVAEARPLSSLLDAAAAEMRFTMVGLTIAAVVGLFMGAVGLYGVVSYLTAQRTREIGVRVALGATPGSVRARVLRQGLTVSGVGLVLGLSAAVGLRGLAAPMLYGIRPTDTATLVVVSLVLLAVGVVATSLPARRAARLDPVQALRWE